MDCPVSNTGKTVMTIVIDREVVGGLGMEEGSNNGPLLSQQDLQPVAETDLANQPGINGGHQRSRN
jgi:hypothetical protein